MKKLPKINTTTGNATDVQTVFTKQEAHDTVDRLIERNTELEQIFEALQPLLYTLSVAMYGEDNAEVSLAKLVQDSVTFIAGRNDGVLQ